MYLHVCVHERDAVEDQKGCDSFINHVSANIITIIHLTFRRLLWSFEQDATATIPNQISTAAMHGVWTSARPGIIRAAMCVLGYFHLLRLPSA